jgi:hypothetical protein
MTGDPFGADALDVAIRVARAVESVGGAYFVDGSVASSMQGEPRGGTSSASRICSRVPAPLPDHGESSYCAVMPAAGFFFEEPSIGYTNIRPSQ